RQEKRQADRLIEQLAQADKTAHALNPTCIGDIEDDTIRQWTEYGRKADEFEIKDVVPIPDLDGDGTPDRLVKSGDCDNRGNCFQFIYLSNHGCTLQGLSDRVIQYAIVDDPQNTRLLLAYSIPRSVTRDSESVYSCVIERYKIGESGGPESIPGIECPC